jgi:hypothetical protein
LLALCAAARVAPTINKYTKCQLRRIARRAEEQQRTRAARVSIHHLEGTTGVPSRPCMAIPPPGG